MAYANLEPYVYICFKFSKLCTVTFGPKEYTKNHSSKILTSDSFFEKKNLY